MAQHALEQRELRDLPRIAPGDKGLPWLGRFLEYAKDPVAFYRHQWETYGEVSPFYAAGELGVVALGPDACEEVLRNGDKAFASGPGWGRIVGPFFDRGLMLLDFDEHHLHRRIMQEAF
ncbi:MAG: cytochrome P450, partial [Nocardioides sp.]|nr:cytochrome P450 [Nocardioides sp.]